MTKLGRRQMIARGGCAIAALAVPLPADALGGAEKRFIAEAARMKRDALASGDQPFGAVIVKDGAIVGYGPSRVLVDRNADAHAERVALWDAQKRLGTQDMTGAIMYSTSRPCSACERTLALANVDRMYFGSEGTDAGKPRRSP